MPSCSGLLLLFGDSFCLACEGLPLVLYNAGILTILMCLQLGGLLFGFDIGATSGAMVSVVSQATSGTTWWVEFLHDWI